MIIIIAMVEVEVMTKAQLITYFRLTNGRCTLEDQMPKIKADFGKYVSLLVRFKTSDK